MERELQGCLQENLYLNEKIKAYEQQMTKALREANLDRFKLSKAGK
jgi:hypothetical protein